MIKINDCLDIRRTVPITVLYTLRKMNKICKEKKIIFLNVPPPAYSVRSCKQVLGMIHHQTQGVRIKIQS